MDSKTRLLYWLLNASRGGPTRAKLLKILDKKPLNARKLSMEMSLDYKTVQGHIELLLENGILETPNKGYGSVYFISPEWDAHIYLKQILKGGNDEKTKIKKAK